MVCVWCGVGVGVSVCGVCARCGVGMGVSVWCVCGVCMSVCVGVVCEWCVWCVWVCGVGVGVSVCGVCVWGMYECVCRCGV